MELTIEEKASLVTGEKNKSTHAIPGKGIRKLFFSDGPCGVRKETEKGNSLGGIGDTLVSTSFPCGTNLASSFDKKLLYEVGDAIGKECVHYGIDVLLGPAINIKRSPLCGRNFDYFSEDPLLSGMLARSYIEGIQANNVSCSLKHFACNNSEKYRFVGTSYVDERALREIYLKNFRIALEAKPFTLMTAYNKVNDEFCSQNEKLLSILRKEWGYQGVVMTDWGGIVDKVKSLNAGHDLEMPGMQIESYNNVIRGYNDRTLDLLSLDQSVERIEQLAKRTEGKPPVGKDIFERNYAIAVDAACRSAVLLKNRGSLLPLAEDKSLFIVGDFFEHARYQGSGSSLLNPYRLITPKAFFDSQGVDYRFFKGYSGETNDVDEKLEKEAMKEISESDTVLFFCGLNDDTESEGFDRKDMLLPRNQVSLLRKILSLKKKIVLVLFGGSSIELENVTDIDGILLLSLPGEGVGEAVYDLLFGKVSPSGRLAETWPMRLSDIPYRKEFAVTPFERYKESLFVGYRYYDTFDKEVRFPFGYGLSYTEFQYSEFTLLKQDGDSVFFSYRLHNIGNKDGEEVVLLFASIPSSAAVRPTKELVFFDKVFLKAGEEKAFTIVVRKKDLAIFDAKKEKFLLEQGNYCFLLAKDSQNVLFSLSVRLEGEEYERDERYELLKKNMGRMSDDAFSKFIGFPIPEYEKAQKGKYTMETPLCEFQSFFGKLFVKITTGIGLSQYRKALRLPDGPEKERRKKAGLFVYRLMPYNCLRSLCYSSSGQFRYKFARGVLNLVNGKVLKAIRCFLKKEKKEESKR